MSLISLVLIRSARMYLGVIYPSPPFALCFFFPFLYGILTSSRLLTRSQRYILKEKPQRCPEPHQRCNFLLIFFKFDLSNLSLKLILSVEATRLKKAHSSFKGNKNKNGTRKVIDMKKGTAKWMYVTDSKVTAKVLRVLKRSKTSQCNTREKTFVTATSPSIFSAFFISIQNKRTSVFVKSNLRTGPHYKCFGTSVSSLARKYPTTRGQQGV